MEKETFASLEIGDIVWVKRYNTEKEKNKIPKGHQEGPAVIIKKNKRATYILDCTSNPHRNIGWDKLIYPLKKYRYNLDKNSYILDFLRN